MHHNNVSVTGSAAKCCSAHTGSSVSALHILSSPSERDTSFYPRSIVQSKVDPMPLSYEFRVSDLRIDGEPRVTYRRSSANALAML
jgi:hypothetical protein